jgi:hypothetical protein
MIAAPRDLFNNVSRYVTTRISCKTASGNGSVTSPLSRPKRLGRARSRFQQFRTVCDHLMGIGQTENIPAPMIGQRCAGALMRIKPDKLSASIAIVIAVSVGA